MTDEASLLAQVAAAFPAEPVPSRRELLNSHCPECIEVSEVFRSLPWPEITLQDLRVAGGTTLLNPIGWRYYLPAVISWCIREPVAVDVILDNIVYALEPPKPTADPERHEWFCARVYGITEPQREAILGYLNWYREREEAEWGAMQPPEHVYRALEYWASDEAIRATGRAG